MKLRLSILLLAAALAASPAAGQTIKSLGYNASNGVVPTTALSNLPLTFTNLGGIIGVNFSSGNVLVNSNTVTFYGTNSGLAFSAGANASQIRNQIGLGATNNVTFSNITASGTLAVTGNVTMSGTDNLAPSQTTNSASSLMTRGLSDARYSPMPMTPQIVPWFYNGTLSVARVTNGSAAIGTLAAYPSITLTTNAADSGAMIMTADVWGAVDSAANPWNAVGRSVIIQGRLGATASNAVARFVWSSSTNWSTLITNVGTNGISNIGWAVETRNTGGSTEARLIVNGATNKSESAWTPIGFATGNDSSFMVVPRAGSTSLYWASEASTFIRTPLITVTNQIGGIVSGAFQGGLGLAVVNTNTPSGTSFIYIRRCYQVLGMTNYGY